MFAQMNPLLGANEVGFEGPPFAAVALRFSESEREHWPSHRHRVNTNLSRPLHEEILGTS